MEQDGAWGLAAGKWLLVGSTSLAIGLALNCSTEASVVVSDSSIWQFFM